MLIVGCDLHPSWQQIAWLDTETGETGEQKLLHASGGASLVRTALGMTVGSGGACARDDRAVGLKPHFPGVGFDAAEAAPFQSGDSKCSRAYGTNSARRSPSAEALGYWQTPLRGWITFGCRSPSAEAPGYLANAPSGLDYLWLPLTQR